MAVTLFEFQDYFMMDKVKTLIEKIRSIADFSAGKSKSYALIFETRSGSIFSAAVYFF